MPDAWDLSADLEALHARGLRRFRRTIDPQAAGEVLVDGRRATLLCSNDYLGLATDPEVVAGARAALERYGAGSGSSRLISGSLRLHGELEEAIADWKGAERAIVFSSGYHANLGVLPALLERHDVVFSDELNHASLIDGCRLSRAEVKVYPHRDAAALGRLLAETRGARRRLVVTDSVFSMDGDRAPLAEICAVAESHGAAVMVDEAHATGVFGASGAGLVEEAGLHGRVLVQMGTLGKALGSFGAYVAGSSELVELLVNRARTFVFTTALPPAASGAAAAAIRIVRREPARRARLWENARRLHRRLVEGGAALPALESPILPLVVGDAARTMRLCEALLEHGVFAQGIRPPTVPPGTSRIRITLMATHGGEALDRAAEAFVRCLSEVR